MPVDANGKALRNAITWLDERSRAQLQPMRDKVGAERIQHITGKPLSITPSISKILWLMEHEPETIKRAHKIVDVHAFLVYRLIGQFSTSMACADPMGLIDMQAGTWASEVMRDLGMDVAQFSQLFRPGEVMGEVTAHAAQATGLPVG